MRHHVSVLSNRNHALSKEAEKKRDDDGAEVASPARVQEPEPQVVAEPEGRISRVIVGEAEEYVWVAPVAKPAVAESRVALEIREPEVALVKLPKGKRRRTDGDEGVKEDEGSEAVEVVKGIIVATSIPRKPRGMVVVAGARVGPRGVRTSGRGAVNPNFPMFFNHSRHFAGECEKWPARRGGGYRSP